MSIKLAIDTDEMINVTVKQLIESVIETNNLENDKMSQDDTSALDRIKSRLVGIVNRFITDNTINPIVADLRKLNSYRAINIDTDMDYDGIRDMIATDLQIIAIEANCSIDDVDVCTLFESNNGQVITDPFTTECGRFPVNPFVYYDEPFWKWINGHII